MGWKSLLTSGGMEPFSLAAMLIALAAFAAIVIWTVTRPREQIDADARLWMDDESR